MWNCDPIPYKYTTILQGKDPYFVTLWHLDFTRLTNLYGSEQSKLDIVR